MEGAGEDGDELAGAGSDGVEEGQSKAERGGGRPERKLAVEVGGRVSSREEEERRRGSRGSTTGERWTKEKERRERG